MKLDIKQIQSLIPHRYPMLLVDQVVDIVKGEEAVGIKNVTMNEWFFQGHFPDEPVMPGVLIVEAMAQTAGIVVMNAEYQEAAANKLVYFMSIEEARFRKPVLPGHTLKLHVKKVRSRGPIWKFSAEAKVDDALMAEATFSAMIADGDASK
jgi:3-hydroxyacyl-[acyl-carrier-protein] dehydratase